MLKLIAISEDSTKPILLALGLSRGNVWRLTSGQPVLVKASKMGLPFNLDVLIFYGESEAQMLKDFQDVMGPGLTIHIEKGVPDDLRPNGNGTTH